MRYVEVRHGHKAMVNNQDFEWLNNYKWYYSHGYARGWVNGKFVAMHRLLNKTPAGYDTDHINQNKLDNRRRNLRTVNRSVNNFNTGVRVNNTSGYKGVRLHVSGKWHSRITINYREISLGYFDSPKKAAQAYNKAVKERIYGKD